MRKLTIVMFVALSVGAAPRFTSHRVVVETEPFVITAELPEGWTADGGQIVPPEAMRSACRVTTQLIQGQEWKSVVAAALREYPEWRQMKKVGGHEAAEYRSTVGSRLTDTVYVNLDSLVPAGVAIWRVEADTVPAGRQCEMEFSALANSLTIDHPIASE